MGTLNTTINLNSIDSLPFPLNQSVSYTGNVGNFVESGVKNIQVFTQEFFNTGNGNITNNNCGPNGMHVLLQSPATNKYNIKLYGYQQINEELEELTFDGIESFATLKPGDSMIVNLSPQQQGIFAATTFGTGVLNYYIADRGGSLGESTLIIDSQSTANYSYIILDSQLAEALPSGFPIPYGSPSQNTKDLGLTTSDWNSPYIEIVNNKGYILKFTNKSNANNITFKFINSRGEIADTFTTTFVGGYNSYNLDSRGYAIVYLDGANVKVVSFDGDNVYYHSFIGTDYYLAGDFDNSTADGSFVLEIYDYNSNSGDEAFILINKDKSYILSVLNQGSSYLYASDTAVYGYGNFIYFTIYDDDNGWYKKYQIWNTNGVLLKDIDISNYRFTSQDYYFYGENKHLVVFSNGSNLATSNTDYILQYNGSTNKVIGYNSLTQRLDQFHYYNTNGYNYRQIYAYSKYPTNSIRPYGYTWNSGLYDADSVAIVYSDEHDNINAHINSHVIYCDIIYLLKDQTAFTKYTFANDETKYIRIPNNGGGYNRITPSSNLVAFTYSTGTQISGSLNILAITSTGVATGSLIPLLENVYSGSNDITTKPVGDYIMYNWYTPGTDTTTYAMVKNAIIKDTVNIAGDSRYPGVWRSRVNSLLLRSWNYPTPRNWYFNTESNRFVELTAGGNSYNINNPYYPAHYVQHSTTTNGLNDGNILLGPSGGTITSNFNNNIRLLKKGVVTGNVTLPPTDGDWSLFLGSEAVFFIYQDMNDEYKYKVNVYDLNLNLKRTESLLTDNLYSFNNFDALIGKRFYVRTYNADPLGIQNLYSYYMISLNGVAYWTNPYNLGIIIDDQYWYQYN